MLEIGELSACARLSAPNLAGCEVAGDSQARDGDGAHSCFTERTRLVAAHLQVPLRLVVYAQIDLIFPLFVLESTASQQSICLADARIYFILMLDLCTLCTASLARCEAPVYCEGAKVALVSLIISHQCPRSPLESCSCGPPGENKRLLTASGGAAQLAVVL